MDVTDTKLFEKCCSKCDNIKKVNLFIPKRNICKECRNKNTREKYKLLVINDEIEQQCNVCKNTKKLLLFVKNRKICIDCNNIKRRTKYENDENHRINIIQKAMDFKQKKIVEKNIKKENEIGINNKICNCCNKIKNKIHFRINRLKCKDCERDEPMEKFKRVIRSRIISALTYKNKNTIEYLGCNTIEYLNWLLKNNYGYTLENRGNQWHRSRYSIVSFQSRK